MPELTAVSLEAKAVVSVRDMIANSATFAAQVLIKAPTVPPPDRVYFYEAYAREQGATLRSLRPFVVVGLSDDIEFRALSPACNVRNLINSGSVFVKIQDNASSFAGGTIQDAYIDFLNLAFGICADMSGVFGGPLDQVGFSRIDLVEPVERTDHTDRDQDDFFQVLFAFVYGEGNAE